MPGFNLQPRRSISRRVAIGSLVIMILIMIGGIVMYIQVSSNDPAPYSSRPKVCYYTSWAHDRYFTADSVDYKLCNHLIYSFMGLDPASYTVKILDAAADLSDNGGLGLLEKLVTRAAKEEVTVQISLGGWTESNNEAWPKLFANETLMDTFVASAVEFLKKYKVQGVNLDYEYPGCPQGTCTSAAETEEGRNGFSKLVVKLRAAFKEYGYLLTAAMSANVGNIEKYYNPALLQENLDWIGLMTYDYAIGSDKVTGLTAPLKEVKASVEAWLSKGLAAGKLVLGVPLYGVSFTLSDKSHHDIGAPAAGIGTLKRALRYNEICANIKNDGWTAVSKPENGGSYAYKEDQWVGFDAAADLKIKGQYILEKQLAGYMCWSVDQDDFTDACGQGKYPLLTAISNTLDGK